MKIEVDLYAAAKRLRLEQLDNRVKHLEEEYKYWRSEFYNHGDKFAQGMMNVSVDLWTLHKRLRDRINDPRVICMPRPVYQFPTTPES